MNQRTTAERFVLVADDDEDLRALIAATLRADGYDVIEASDGIELLDWLDRAVAESAPMPEVIISDVRMPVVSGLGVLRAMKDANVSLPVILITIFPDESTETVVERLGATGVLKKPFDMDDLRTAVLNARTVHARASGKFKRSAPVTR